MASSRHSVMQCSSLPQMSGRGKPAIPSAISRHLTPHTSTHRLHPLHFLAPPTGSHFALMIELSSVSLSTLLHDNGAFHPRVRCALEMHHPLLVESLFKGGARCQHRRRKFSFFAEDAMSHADINVFEENRHSRLDR